MRRFALIAATVCFAVSTLSLSPAWAAPLYETNFVGTAGSLPTDWAVLAGETGSPGWRIDPSGEYRFDGTGSGLSHFTGTYTNGQPANSLTNGTIEANFRKSSAGVYTGLAARIQPSGNSYYSARLYGGNLQVYTFGPVSLLGSAPAFGYDAGDTWRIEMNLVDTLITSRVFDQSGTEIAVVTVNDDSFTSGTAGVRSNKTAVWEDFQVSAPEGLLVDIGENTTTNDVQAGFQSFAENNDSGSSYAAGAKEQWFESELGNANRVRVNVASTDPVNGRLGWRDRGDVTHALGDLVEDFVFNLDGTRLNLTLGSLKPGRYQMTTYMHDRDNGVRGPVDVSVSDATQAERLVADNVVQTSGATPSSVASASFTFISDGIDPVVIHIDEQPGSNLVMINGFETNAMETLRVDFGLNGQDVQDSFFDFSLPGNTGAVTETVASAMGAGGTVDVTVNPVSGVLEYRNRGNMVNSELGDMAEDFVFSRSQFELSVDDLAAGTYMITTYHHDLGYGWAPIDVEISDALGSNRIVATDFTQSRDDITDLARLTIPFVADGINPVTLGFDVTTAGNIAMLSGFSLTTFVPEPSTLALAALGFCGLLGCAVRRKKH